MSYGARSVLGKLGTVGILTVEKAKGVLFKARLEGVAKAIALCIEIAYERCAVCRAALLTTDRVDMKLNVLKAEAAKNGICKRNCSSV